MTSYECTTLIGHWWICPFSPVAFLLSSVCREVFTIKLVWSTAILSGMHACLQWAGLEPSCMYNIASVNHQVHVHECMQGDPSAAHGGVQFRFGWPCVLQSTTSVCIRTRQWSYCTHICPYLVLLQYCGVYCDPLVMKCSRSPAFHTPHAW